MDRRPPPDKKPSTHYAAMQELKSMTEERDAWRLLANSYVDMYRKVFNKIITMEKCSCQEMEKLYKEILKG